MDLPTSDGLQKPLPNGLPAKPPVAQNGEHIVGDKKDTASNREDEALHNSLALANGVAHDDRQNGAAMQLVNRLDGLPIEVKQLTEHFQPLYSLFHRSAQQSWNEFSELWDRLINIPVAPSGTVPNSSLGKSQVNGVIAGDQSPGNLTKKDDLLYFQQEQRTLYIKLLVLLDWFHRSRGIEKVIELGAWIRDQRSHFNGAADFVGNMKRELALWQVQNPDLKTAIEVLSCGKVSTLSDLGYVPTKRLSSRGMLKTLREIDILLCARLSLSSQLPQPLSKYRIHDGRITFTVQNEFELDLSVADGDPSSPFYFIDFRFLFSQHSALAGDRLHSDLASRMNDMLRTDGLLPCYEFLHDLTLSYKLNNFRRQVLDMVRKQWSESLKVDLITRTLVVQYWLSRPMAKSWIELGVRSGRRRRRIDKFRPPGPHLDLRWIPEKRENQEPQLDVSSTTGSMETIIHGVIARHSSIILEGLYDNLVEAKLYSSGLLALELSCSDAKSSSCSLHIQLTRSKHITLSIEPISGSLILSPASSLSGRTEFELNRLQSPVEGGPQHISMLRCLAAEQEIAGQAINSGWEVLHAYRLSNRELRALFPPKTLRYLLLRLTSWQEKVMVAVTFSMDGDHWWLIYPPKQATMKGPDALISYQLPCPQRQGDTEKDSASFFATLKTFSSGAIALKVAEQELRQKMVPSKLPELPLLQEGFQLPPIRVQCDYSSRKRALDHFFSNSGARNVLMESSNGPMDEKPKDHPSSLQPTVYLRFCGLNQATHHALLLAKGKTGATREVLQSLTSLRGLGFKANIDAGEFLISFQVPIGKSVVSELFTSLQNLDSLLSCLAITKSFNSIRIQPLSLSQMVIGYYQGAGLSVSIDFPSPSSSAIMSFLPEDSNPHNKISKFLNDVLTDLKRPFTANLGGVLEILTMTRPLLTLFDELEKLQPPPTSATESTDDPSIVYLHILSRSPTHHAIQYFAHTRTSRVMVARFEIFRHLRRDTPVWILRPALEETVSYSRSSFVDPALKQKITEEIFQIRGAEGWLGLDTGASCPVERPEPLVRKVDEVVRDWSRESLREMLEAGQKQDEGAKVESGGKGVETKTEPNVTPRLQQQKQVVGTRPPPGSAGQSRPPVNAQRPQQGRNVKDAITLD
jgi:mediator of RNA polymerase II transcription subunit 14